MGLLVVVALALGSISPAFAQPPSGPPTRGTPRAQYVFPILRLGAGPRFELDGRNGGEWNVRAGIFFGRRVGLQRSAPWYRVEADFAFLRNARARSLGGGVVGLFGPLAYFQAGYSVRAFADHRDDFHFAIRHGLATRYLGGLLSLDVEHERVLALEDSAIVVTFSIDLAALLLGAGVVTGAAR